MQACSLCSSLHSLLVVFEDDRVAVVVHEDWAVRGHLMVVSKRHVENISDLSEDEWLHLARVYRRAERAVLDLTRADRAMILKLGIATPHLHLHIYPVPAMMSREEVTNVMEARSEERYDDVFVVALRASLTQGIG